jgi:hypothetical protein
LTKKYYYDLLNYLYFLWGSIMKSVPADKERRRFLHHAFSIGTLAWLTPVILTVTAKKAHARFSGDGNATGRIKNNPTVAGTNPGGGTGKPGLDLFD